MTDTAVTTIRRDEVLTPRHANVHEALAAAQGEMSPPEKNATNQAFKRDGAPSKYADLSSVVESIRDPLSRHGLCWGWRTVDFRDGLAMEAWIAHGASGTEVSCPVPLYVDRNNMHGLKSAYTYAKRIGLESVSGQAPADDDDGNAAAAAPAPREVAPQAQPVAPGKEAIDAAVTALSQAETLDALRDVWTSLSRPVQHVPAVEAAKDKRKAELDENAQEEAVREPGPGSEPTSNHPHRNADIGGDQIPY